MKGGKPGPSVGKPPPDPEAFAANVWLGPPAESTGPPGSPALRALVGTDSAETPAESPGHAGASGETEVFVLCSLPPLRAEQVNSTNPEHHGIPAARGEPPRPDRGWEPGSVLGSGSAPPGPGGHSSPEATSGTPAAARLCHLDPPGRVCQESAAKTRTS